MENKTKIDLKNTSIFITGAAGFIGSNLAKRILTTVEGAKVVGLDNMNHYYDVRLKEARLDELNKFENFSFVKGNLADKETITTIFEQYKPQIVVNLGAQAGVRYSITNPDAYVEANLIGFYNILEACRHSYDEGHMWGLTPDFLGVLEEGFKEFFEKEVPGNPMKAEYLIPIFIGELLEQGKMSVKVLKTNDTWYGMTYHEDVASVKDSFKKMLENGVYKADLFSDL